MEASAVTAISKRRKLTCRRYGFYDISRRSSTGWLMIWCDSVNSGLQRLTQRRHRRFRCQLGDKRLIKTQSTITVDLRDEIDAIGDVHRRTARCCRLAKACELSDINWQAGTIRLLNAQSPQQNDNHRSVFGACISTLVANDDARCRRCCSRCVVFPQERTPRIASTSPGQ